MNAVITYIFGKNSEILRTPLVIDTDVEYICVTDQQDLKSDVWKIVYEPMPNINSNRDKVVYVKFNPFKYTKAEKILVIDSSMEIKTSIQSLFDEYDDYEIGLKLHPIRDFLSEELPNWKYRGLTDNVINKFYKMAKIDGVNLSEVTEYEGCLILFKNNDFCKNLCKLLFEYMKILGENGNLIVTNQCPLSYIIHTFYKKSKIYIIERNKYFNRYFHNTKKIVEEKR